MKKTHLLLVGLILCYWIKAAENGIVKPHLSTPVMYSPNNGQVLGTDGRPVSNVLAKSSINGLDFYITTTGVTYVLKQYEEVTNARPHPVYINEPKYTIKYSRVDVVLAGATINSTALHFNGQQPLQVNYYMASGGKPITGVKNYSAVTIQNVYPGIDWVWKSTADGKLEYDFVVHPGSNPAQIKMQYKYADITPSANSLLIGTHNGTLREGDLKAHCNSQPVDVAYVYNAGSKEISFNVGRYDNSHDLIIDPPLALQWSAQYGGTFADGLRGIANDNRPAVSQPFIYLTGYTNSTNFPLINPGGGAYFDNTYNGNTDVVLMKLDTNQVPRWISYLGGSGNDFGNSITVSSWGNVFVTGSAQTGMPVVNKPGAYNQGTAIAQDAFVAQFDTSLILRWSTFYGGIGNEEGLKIHTDKYNRLYVAGYTNSPGNTLYTLRQDSGYYQNLTIGSEAFILKFDTNGHALWATLYGAAGDDVATSIATDSLANVVVTGFTTSTNLPVTMDTSLPFYHQITNAGGTDGFLLRFDSLSYLKRGTYYGGAGNDYFNDVTIGQYGDYIFTGRTSSADFPNQQLNQQSYQQPALAGSYDAFIVKCKNNLNRKWATYYGGSGLDVGTGVATSPGGSIYITGFTFSTDLPLDSPLFNNAFYQDSLSGQADGFLAGFENYGKMFWSTYKGDSCYDYPADISYANSNGMFFVCGEGLYSCTGSFIDTSAMHGGAGEDGFCWAFGGGGAVVDGGGGGGGGGGGCFSMFANVKKNACPNQCNGQAELHVQNEIGPLNIIWSSGYTGMLGSGLCFDTAWVKVQDENGCERMQYLYFDSMHITMGATVITCPGGGNVWVNISGGTSPFHFSWGGVDTFSYISNVHYTGPFHVNIVDANGCTASGDTSLTSIDYNATQEIHVLHSPSCGQTDGMLVAVDIATQQPVVVEWMFNDTTVVDDTLTGIGIGAYFIDNYDCILGNLFPVQVHLQDTVDMASEVYLLAQDSSCVFNTGALTVAIDSVKYGDNAPYTFFWSTGDTTATINNLQGDSTYFVTITDVNGCSVLKSGYIEDLVSPHVLIDTSSIVNSTCAFMSDGSVAPPVVWGGEAPYTYTWHYSPYWIENFPTDTTIPYNSLAAGLYELTVTDANGCTATNAFGISHIGQPNLLFAFTPEICSGDANGTISVGFENSSGLPYTILWDNGQTGPVVTGLSADTIYVTVTLSNGQTFIGCAAIGDGDTVNTNIVEDPYDCANSGLPLYVYPPDPDQFYQWSTGENNPIIYAHGTADIDLTVTNISGCSATATYHVETADSLKAEYTIDSIHCYGDVATINIFPSGGFLPYNGADPQYVTAGIYQINVYDSYGCFYPLYIDVPGPTEPLTFDIAADPIICNGQPAFVNVSAQGGVFPYNGTTVIYLYSGTYFYTITDDLGCQIDTAIEITEPPVLFADYTAGEITCDSTWIEITATGGVSPYTGVGIQYQPAGTYNFDVVDSLGCTVTVPVTLTGPDPFEFSYMVDPILCNGDSATISVTATGGTQPYSGVGLFSYPAGTIDLFVTDNNGCTHQQTVVVTEPTALVADVETTPVLCNGNNSNVTIVASGGTQPYNGTGTFSYTAGAYQATVIDDNGCSTTVDYQITEPEALQIEVTVPDTLDCAADSVEVFVTASGGVGPYSGTGGYYYYSSGTYNLEVSDANGCVISSNANVIVSGAHTQIIASDDTICVNGAVYLTATGDFEFTWYPYDFHSSGLSIAHVPSTTTVNIVGVNNAGCYAYDTLTIVVESCDTTGINDLDALQFTVYPNPATDRFIVQVNGGFASAAVLTLYAADGRLVQEQRITAGVLNTEVECATLASGVYLMQINSSGKNYYHKVVVSR